MKNHWRDNADHMVVWADGTYDTQRDCAVCGLRTCTDPVHKERYKIIGQAVIETEDAEAGQGYWAHMTTKMPLGGDLDFDGDWVVGEFNSANPDQLLENNLNESGTSEQQHKWMQEAYRSLTSAQKEVWDAIMREQISQTELARRLNITQQAVEKRLTGAKLKVSNYLRGKQNEAP